MQENKCGGVDIEKIHMRKVMFIIHHSFQKKKSEYEKNDG